MSARTRTSLAAATCAFAAMLLVLATPALADGRENQIDVNGRTYGGPAAIVDAFRSLGRGTSTMTLRGDCEYESYQGANVIVPAGATLTLVLNGYDLDAEGCSLSVQGSLVIENGNGGRQLGDVAFEPWRSDTDITVTGSLTLNGGEISGENGVAVRTQGSGAFTMNGGKVDGDVRAGAVVVASGGRVAINGGSIENGSWNGQVVAAQGGSVQVSGGSFEPTAIPASMLTGGAIQVGVQDDGDMTYTVGSNGAILSYLNGLRWGSVNVVNGTLNITQPIPSGMTVSASSTGALQVNGVATNSYTGTGQAPTTPGTTQPNPNPSPDPGPSYPDYAMLEPIYRLYNPWTYGRYYCDDYDDAKDLMRHGWDIEGIGWYAPEDGTDVYQLYNPYNQDHYWTMSLSEYRSLIRQGWRGEGDAWESAPASTGKPIYQLFNPWLSKNTHMWTSDGYEVGVLTSRGWRNEGAKWYAAALPPR